jgi:Domain of unknown function (DUF5666)
MTIDVKRWAMVLSAATLAAAFSGASASEVSAGVRAPAPTANVAQDQASPQGGPDERRLPLFGKITAIHDGSMDVLDTNGDTISVKFNGQTQFRKDRQPAKRTDFKVGDVILVRGQEAADHSWTAEVVAARSMNGQGGPGGPGRGRGGFQQQGTLGKDYVTGEIKSVDAPKLTVLRSDNVTQTLELNEETSMRKGRDSITMADIQAGDHILARGALENNVFVPKNVVVIGPEQWKRMQEFGQQAGVGRRRQQGGQSQEGSSGAADAPSPNPPSPAPAPAPAPTPQFGQEMEPHR